MLRLRIVQAAFGDCFILEYGDPSSPKRMLIDGGPSGIYASYLSPELDEVRKQGGRLDHVVLSHIDEDHVMGLLDFFTELERQRQEGESLQVEVGSLWHNTFSDIAGKDTEDRLRKLLKETPPSGERGLGGGTETFLIDLNSRSIEQGDTLTQAAATLDVPINPEFSPTRIICADDLPAPLTLDGLTLRIVGPTRKNLERLQKKWLAWLKKKERDLQRGLMRALDQSYPNLSSLMFLVESNGKTILFTGDGRGDHLLKSLRQAGLLKQNGRLHVNVLKLPHHGSVRNASLSFFQTITADRYVISADGQYENPDLDTLVWIAQAAKADGRFVEYWVTNETDNTRKFRAAFDPNVYNYRWIQLEKSKTSMVLDLEALYEPGSPQPAVIPPAIPLEPVQPQPGEPAQPATPTPPISTGGIPMSRKALLVGINQFARPDWTLRGCVNDTQDMQNLLMSYYNFEDDEIRILCDLDATHQGIRDGIAWLLSDYTGQGDVRLFHFSSHGTQVPDQNGDEWECKDEVIVPHDHSWEQPFRDDELRELFANIPDPVNFAFIADCCHSGSIQKALLDSEIDFIPRYVSPPIEMLDKIDEMQASRDAMADQFVAQQLAQLMQTVPPEELQAKMAEYIAAFRKRFRDNRYGVVETDKHILLAGCEDKQTSADAYIEGEYRGAFTWALGRAIRDANGNLTYGQLIKNAASLMKAYTQKPQLECPGAAQGYKVFSPVL